jgi:hypothetical protein
MGITGITRPSSASGAIRTAKSAQGAVKLIALSARFRTNLYIRSANCALSNAEIFIFSRLHHRFSAFSAILLAKHALLPNKQLVSSVKRTSFITTVSAHSNALVL